MAPPQQKNQQKVLIIEDEEYLLDIIKRKLIHEGYVVDIAKDGEAGLDKIKKLKPDLILLDIILPKIGGFEILEIMNKDPKLSAIPVIIVSNSGQPVEIDRALKLGVKDYLIKTEFDPKEIIDKVKNLFNNKSIDMKPKKEINNNKKVKILLVEDEQFLRELCEKKLKKEGFAVSIAIDGETGLKKIIEEKPSLVLLDIILPTMDGFEILKRVRKNSDPDIATIPIIILSNLGQESDLEKAKKLKANDYMIKAHFTPDEVIKRIKTILKNKKIFL